MSNTQKTHGGHELAELVRKAYEKGEIDYSLNPMTLGTGFIKDGDHVVFCCRRGEREIELTEMFTEPDFAKTERKLRVANKSECMEYFDKKRDLVLGSAPTDIVTAIFGVSAGAIAIMAADDREKRISRLLTGVFPALAGIGTNIALTSMLFSGPKGMVIAAITGSTLSLVGNKVNNYRLKLLGKSEEQQTNIPKVQ